MYLGIDLGTSGVKAAVLAGDGRTMATASAPLSASHPRSGWSEQDPEHWWAGTDAAVLAIDPALRSAVRGIGLSGQMHGATLLDDADRVLRPCILWNDGRSAAQCRALKQAEPAVEEITGNLVMPGFTAPKLLWVRDNEPEIFARIATVLLPKDYLRLRMTGAKVSDMSDSAGTLWLDMAKRDWSDAMLAACGMDRRQMPRLHEGPEITATLRPEVASAWGMERVPVVAGGGDNAAGAVGAGVVNPGDAFLSLGTSGVTFVATESYRPNSEGAVHTFCHALPGRWHQMAVHLSAASCIDWAMRQLGAPDAAAFHALAQSVEPFGGPEIFLPFLSGERTPHNDPDIRAGWLRCDSSTQPARLASAVLEGVAFAFADGIEALRNAGSPVEEAMMIGGGARSRHWGTILASSTRTRLLYGNEAEAGPAVGAARLALAGVSRASVESICPKPDTVFVAEPDEALANRLAPNLSYYRRAYGALSSIEDTEQ
ncbi:MAG: xylulokinase [Erythrobacter sp.]|nr:xylulokinase [Erythrobacter sp.]NCQ63024.1 xylulokinase [Alphaproteobacteria bacterium]